MKKSNIKKICLCAIMAALYVGLDYLAVTFSSPFSGTMKLSISGLPVLISAFMFGPIWGAATGFVGAFLGQLITHGLAPTTLLWVLPAVARGLSSGLLFILFKKSLKPIHLIPQIIISSLLVTAINTIVLYIDTQIYGYYIKALFTYGLLNRTTMAVLTSIFFAIALPPIVKSLKKVIK